MPQTVIISKHPLNTNRMISVIHTIQYGIDTPAAYVDTLYTVPN